MNISWFNLLSLDQKCEIIDKDGVYLAGRNEGVYAFNLYSIYSFYAELCYNFKDYNLEKVRVLSKTDELEPYLNEINLFI
jgi:hypothetical protein